MYVLMSAVLIVAVPDRQDPTPKQADPLMQQILGEWRLVKHVIDGREIGLNDVVIVFGGDTMQRIYLRDGRPDPGSTHPYTLEAARNPAVIEFPSTKYIAIIKVEGDLLTICFAKSGDTVPPAEFVSTAETATTLMRAVRIRK
jgi:uncharacterized protein (TIGR03067 family)